MPDADSNVTRKWNSFKEMHREHTENHSTGNLAQSVVIHLTGWPCLRKEALKRMILLRVIGRFILGMLYWIRQFILKEFFLCQNHTLTPLSITRILKCKVVSQSVLYQARVTGTRMPDHD